MAGTRSRWIVATLLTWGTAGTAAMAQSPSTPVNPRAFEFELPAEERSDIVGYWVEVFRSGKVVMSTPPLRVIYVAKPSRENSGSLRVDLGNQLDGLADGEYVVTLSVAGRLGPSPFSAPSEPFAVSGLANRPPPQATPAAARRVPTEPPPQATTAARSAPTEPTPQAAPIVPEAKPNNEPHSWWWIALAGILAAFFVPLVL